MFYRLRRDDDLKRLKVNSARGSPKGISKEVEETAGLGSGEKRKMPMVTHDLVRGRRKLASGVERAEDGESLAVLDRTIHLHRILCPPIACRDRR